MPEEKQQRTCGECRRFSKTLNMLKSLSGTSATSGYCQEREFLYTTDSSTPACKDFEEIPSIQLNKIPKEMPQSSIQKKPKFCRDCKHFEEKYDPNGEENAFSCMKDYHMKYNLVTGEEIWQGERVCYEERRSLDGCGPEGRCFEPKEEEHEK